MRVLPLVLSRTERLRGNNCDLDRHGISRTPVLNINDAVFVVSDCESDAEHISALLRQCGYLTESVSDFSELPEAVDKLEFADQFVATVVSHRKTTACHSLPLSQSLPGSKIIVLSDCELEHTVVSILNSGAHHFFNIRESSKILQVRLKSALRKNGVLINESFTVGDIFFDAEKRLIYRMGEIVDLSPKEFDLAYYLFSNRDRLVCNSELMISIWSLPASMDTRRIDTAACKLRKKLQLNSENDWMLKRIRTIGYRLIPVETESVADMEFDGSRRIAAS